MNHISTATDFNSIEPGIGSVPIEDGRSSKGEVIVKVVATAMAVSSIKHVGKDVMTALTKHPLVMFSLGIAVGYLAHKYRKKIISITDKTAEQSKDFVLRQKENIKGLFTETEE